MIRMSKSANGQPLHAVVLLAFDPVTGQVHATFVHGSHGGADPAGIERSREHLLRDVRSRLDTHAQVDTLDIPLEELPEGSIERIDPVTRRIITRTEDTLRVGRNSRE
jgi:hypothetical protein